MNVLRMMLLGFAMLLSTACAAQPQGEPQAPTQAEADNTITLVERPVPETHPVSGLRNIPLMVKTDTEEIGFLVELADTPEAQAKGLMFRTELNEFGGMLFPSERPQIRSFWMKNTPLPLDIIFIGEDNRIINIAANTTPYSLESVRSEGPAIAVFEIRGGRAAQLGIEPGDLVEWRMPE